MLICQKLFDFKYGETLRVKSILKFLCSLEDSKHCMALIQVSPFLCESEALGYNGGMLTA